MGKLAETKFIVTESSIRSEFGYCWVTRASVKQAYTLDLKGDFELGRVQKSGRVCIESNEVYDQIEVEGLEDRYAIRKQFNLGKIELRPEGPSALIEITASYLNHIWDLCNSDKYEVSIKFTTEESVLHVREVASIYVEIEKRVITKKRGFFG